MRVEPGTPGRGSALEPGQRAQSLLARWPDHVCATQGRSLHNILDDAVDHLRALSRDERVAGSRAEGNPAAFEPLSRHDAATRPAAGGHVMRSCRSHFIAQVHAGTWYIIDASVGAEDFMAFAPWNDPERKAEARKQNISHGVYEELRTTLLSLVHMDDSGSLNVLEQCARDLREEGQQQVDLEPCNLLLTPSALHPYTLSPAAYTLNPQTYGLNSTPCTLKDANPRLTSKI